MHFYSISHASALDLPLQTFWLMSNSINRISAEKDIRQLAVSAASQSEQGHKSASNALKEELGSIVQKSTKVSEDDAGAGLKRLKQLAAN